MYHYTRPIGDNLLFFLQSFVASPGVFFPDHQLFFDGMFASPEWTSYEIPVAKRRTQNKIKN